MGASRAMAIAVVGFVLLGFASLHLVAAEELSTVTPAFMWSDLRYGFLLWGLMD